MAASDQSPHGILRILNQTRADNLPSDLDLRLEVDESRVLSDLVEGRIAQKGRVIREAFFGGFSSDVRARG